MPEKSYERHTSCMEYMYSNTQYLHDCKDKDYVR